MEPVTVTMENLEQLSSDLLEKESVIVQIEELVNDSWFEVEPGTARELYEKLEKLLRPNMDNLKLKPQIYNRYSIMLSSLIWKSLPALPSNLRSKVLSNNLVYSLKNGLDVKGNVKKYLDLFEYGVGPDEAERQKLVYSFGNNEETLGSQPLKLKTDDKAVPSLKNWMKDFNAYLPARFNGGKFEQVNYFNNSQNVGRLSSQEKDVLAKIIDLYVWLKYPKIEDHPELKKPSIVPATSRPITSPKPYTTAQSIPKQPAGLPIDKLKSELQKSSAGLSVLEKKYTNPNFLKPSLSPAEIKREVATPELPAHASTTPPSIPPHQGEGSRGQETKEIPPPSRGRLGGGETKAAPAAVDDIKFVDDLKRIGPQHLRRGNLVMEVQKIKSKIAYLAAVNRLFPHEVVNVFEQSPLFKLYLRIGGMLITDRNPDRKAAFEQATAKLKTEGHDALSLPEFESVADLKKEIERM